MKPTSEKILELLQEGITAEFTAVQQYLLHSHLLSDWGFAKIAEHERTEAKEEGEHAALLTERLLFLGGTPDYKTINNINAGTNVEEVLKNDLQLEEDAVNHIRSAIAYCEKDGDYITRDLFLKILDDEEGHIDHLERELSTLHLVGLNNYLQSQYVPQGK